MIMDLYRTFSIPVKSSYFIAFTLILEWKSSITLSIMTERRQRQGFISLTNKEDFPFSLMDGICSWLGNQQDGISLSHTIINSGHFLHRLSCHQCWRVQCFHLWNSCYWQTMKSNFIVFSLLIKALSFD